MIENSSNERTSGETILLRLYSTLVPFSPDCPLYNVRCTWMNSSICLHLNVSTCNTSQQTYLQHLFFPFPRFTVFMFNLKCNNTWISSFCTVYLRALIKILAGNLTYLSILQTITHRQTERMRFGVVRVVWQTQNKYYINYGHFYECVDKKKHNGRAFRV